MSTATEPSKSDAKRVKAAAPPRDPAAELAGRNKAAAGTCRLLGDATRVAVVRMLAAGEMNVTQICAQLDQSQPVVSRHLALLRHTRVIEPRREGKHNFYGLTEKGEAAAGLIESLG